MQRHPHEQDDEIASKMTERHVARYCRRLSYKIRKIRENDPSVTSIQVAIEDVLPSLMKAMEQNMYLYRLEISCTSLSIGGVVARMLQANSTLRILKIRACHIPSFSATTIFRSLKENSTLEELDLSLSWGIFESYPSVLASRDASRTLADVIMQSTTKLKTLNLRKTGIRPDQVQKLFQAISRNRSLETLDVSENIEIGTALSTSLVQYLPRMKLQIINAELTGISECLDQQEPLMAGLARAMKANTSVWKLSGIVLHQVEHYSSEDQRETQRQCIRRFKEIELFQTRNGIIEGKWLLMENMACWPDLLSCVTRGDTCFRNDLVYFLLQQKCEWVGHSPQSCLQEEMTKGGGKPPIDIVKLKRTSGELSLSEPLSRKKPRGAHERVPPGISGYHCPVHSSCGILPRSCCSFERRADTR